MRIHIMNFNMIIQITNNKKKKRNRENKLLKKGEQYLKTIERLLFIALDLDYCLFYILLLRRYVKLV